MPRRDHFRGSEFAALRESGGPWPWSASDDAGVVSSREARCILRAANSTVNRSVLVEDCAVLRVRGLVPVLDRAVLPDECAQLVCLPALKFPVLLRGEDALVLRYVREEESARVGKASLGDPSQFDHVGLKPLDLDGCEGLPRCSDRGRVTRLRSIGQFRPSLGNIRRDIASLHFSGAHTLSLRSVRDNRAGLIGRISSVKGWSGLYGQTACTSKAGRRAPRSCSSLSAKYGYPAALFQCQTHGNTVTVRIRVFVHRRRICEEISWCCQGAYWCGDLGVLYVHSGLSGGAP